MKVPSDSRNANVAAIKTQIKYPAELLSEPTYACRETRHMLPARQTRAAVRLRMGIGKIDANVATKALAAPTSMLLRNNVKNEQDRTAVNAQASVIPRKIP